MRRLAGLALFLGFMALALLALFVEEPWIRTPAVVLAIALTITIS
jgi:hypothetical protein